MKKILTIVGLAVLLCLAISVALAGTETVTGVYKQAEFEALLNSSEWVWLPDSSAYVHGSNLAEVKLASGHNEDKAVKCYTSEDNSTFVLVTVNVNPHVAGSTVKAATCIAPGNKKCTICGETMVGVIPKITTHSVASGNWVYRTVDDPTCDDYGLARLYCKTCNVWIPDTEAELDPTHAHNFIPTIVKLPTCKADGKYQMACKYCGLNEGVYKGIGYKEYTITLADFDANEWLVLANGGKLNGGHKWVNWVDSTPATCLKNKTQIRWCSICELKQEREVANTKLGPVWACDMDPKTVTCVTDPATVTFTCKLCKGANPDHHKVGLYIAAQGVIESPDHKIEVRINHVYNEDNYGNYEQNADGTVKVYPASCTKGAYKRLACELCGAYKAIYTSAPLGHDWTVWECIAAPGESGNTNGLWTRICKRCGKDDSFTGPKQPSALCDEHVAVLDEDNSYAPTCEDEGFACYVCDLCGTHLEELDEVIPALGHDYKVIAEVAATCTENGKGIKICTVCNDIVKDVVIEKLGHKFGEWTVTKAATTEAEGEETRECERCGEKETRKIAKLDKDAKYDVEDLDYTNPVATGTAKLVEGTKALKNAYARVTFFLANGDCMIQIVDVAEDGTFKAGAIGNFVHISVVIVDVDDAYGADEAIEHAHGNAGIKL